MKVPSNGLQPSFEDVFRVGFWRWLFSRKAEREEWKRRRNIALQKLRRQRLRNIAESHSARVAAFEEARRNLREERARKKQQSRIPD